MTSAVFSRYVLRTTDPDAARIFYSEVVGMDVPNGPAPDERSMLVVWPLHEQARARGAPSHWLGQIGVVDVDATVNRLLELGSERLSPTLHEADGTAFATVRDPSGAVVAMRASTRKLGTTPTPVAWHHLHTRDLDKAWSDYSELFGWKRTETLDVAVANPVGGYRMFAWDGAGKTVGSMANTARWPGVHTHWLYYFSVADIEGTLAKVRAHGGTVTAAVTLLPNGDRLAPCGDAQGAAFGLYESATRA